LDYSWNAGKWAIAKATAEKKGRAAEVIALVAPSEINRNVKHMFVLDEFVEFIAKVDPEKGSIGLLGM